MMSTQMMPTVHSEKKITTITSTQLCKPYTNKGNIRDSNG